VTRVKERDETCTQNFGRNTRGIELFGRSRRRWECSFKKIINKYGEMVLTGLIRVFCKQ